MFGDIDRIAAVIAGDAPDMQRHNDHERLLIHATLMGVAALVAASMGLEAGLFTGLQMALVVEALYWFGLPARRLSPHRQNRRLFY